MKITFVILNNVLIWVVLTVALLMIHELSKRKDQVFGGPNCQCSCPNCGLVSEEDIGAEPTGFVRRSADLKLIK